MKARLVTVLPLGPEWLYEVKLDGYRCIALKHAERVQLLSGKGNDLTRNFRPVADALKTVNVRSAVVDGEIVAVNAEGRHSFQALQGRGRMPSAWRVAFYAFDLLHLNGDDLSKWPLERRKAKLEKVIAGSKVLFCPELVGDPQTIIDNVRAFGLEGIVAKKRQSLYESGNRSGAWLKFKTSPAQEFVVGGIKPDAKTFESLLVGYYERDRLIFAGKVRAGFRPHTRTEVFGLLQPLIQSRCPFREMKIVKSAQWSGGVTEEDLKIIKWVKPKLVVQIAFVEWTNDRLLRHPTFVGIREDKAGKDVVRELEF